MILVCGYYFRHNLGDDAFVQTMPALFPKCQLTFRSIDDLKTLPLDREHLAAYQAIIIGSGDLVNDYFWPKLLPLLKAYNSLFPKRKIFAFGIGLPYPQLVQQGYLDHFDHVFLRSKADVLAVQQRLGSTYAHYLPDLAYALPAPAAVERQLPAAPRVGVFLIQSIAKNEAVVRQLSKLLWKLSKQHQLVLYRFNTSGSPTEDDQFINSHLQQLWQKRALAEPSAARRRHPLQLDNATYTAEQMLSEMQGNDFAICMRFHSHVFSCLAGVPFLSICETRKVERLVADLELQEYQVRSDSRSSAMLAAFQRVVANRQQLRSTLLESAEYNAFYLRTSQPENLLLNAPCRDKSIRLSANEIDERARELTQEVSGLLNSPDYTSDQVAELMCARITGQPSSRYLHGTKQNLRERPGDLFEMVKWILLDFLQEEAADDRRIDLDYINQNSFKGVHRAGWQYCVDYLRVLQNPRGVIFDSYVDRTFHWAGEVMQHEGFIPYTSPWIGVVHHTPNTEYTDYNTVKLLECREFHQSLPCCLGLICLSESLAEWLRSRLPVTVISLKHPTAFVPQAQEFSYKKFKSNPERLLVNVGAWYRNPWTLHSLPCPDVVSGKAAIKGKEMDNYFAPGEVWLARRLGGPIELHGGAAPADSVAMCRPTGGRQNKWLHCLERWLLELGRLLSLASEGRLRLYRKKDIPSDFALNLRGSQASESGVNSLLKRLRKQLLKKIDSVRRLEFLNNADYDELLSKNIVFLDLVDCSAANTIIECVVRNTPLVVNPLPAVKEYLGEDYPLYWCKDDGSDLDELLSMDNIKAATRYLSCLDKGPLRASTFIEELKGSAIWQKF